MVGAELTSPRAPRIKAARRLASLSHRRQQRLFLAEGPQPVREALDRPGTVTEVFATAAALERHRDLLAAAHGSDVACHTVPDHVLAALTQTVSPQGVVAVCRFVDVALEAVIAARPMLVAVCANVRDPGNVGVVIRCADAAGAEAVVLIGTSVDPYNGKAVRASAGSLFHVPISRVGEAAAAYRALRAAGMALLAADGDGAIDLDRAADEGRLSGPTAWIFGNEAWGLPPDLTTAADAVVRVPIHGRAESLNLATAAAVCLYASARSQRRPDGCRARG